MEYASEVSLTGLACCKLPIVESEKRLFDLRMDWFDTGKQESDIIKGWAREGVWLVRGGRTGRCSKRCNMIGQMRVRQLPLLLDI